MKKETLIAIFLGVLAGLGVAVIMLEKAREHQMGNVQSLSTSLRASPTVTVRNTQFQALEISQPENGSINATKTIDIKGRASSGSLLVVQSPINTTILKLDKEDFIIPSFPLSLGENTIRLTIYPKDSQIPMQEKELKIYYLDEQ